MKILDIIKEKDVLLQIDTFVEDAKNEKRKIMDVYKLIQSVSSACDKNLNEVKKLLTKHELLEKVEPIRLIADNQNDFFKDSELKNKYKRQVLASFFNVLCEEYKHDNDELLFFTAATLNLPKLKELIKICNNEEINQTRFSDSVILFTIKYADVTDENFFECIKILLESGVNPNRCDISGKFAIDLVANLMKKTNNVELKNELTKVAKLLVDERICKTEDENTISFLQNQLKVNLEDYKFAFMDTKSRLFYWISSYKISEFLKFKKIRHFANCDNGENTILQFSANKSNSMLPVVELLLKNGSDPNLVTQVNPLTPLELAARNNYDAIFKLILNWKQTKVTEEQFNNFVKWRGRSVKRELFGLLLESDKLDPTYTFHKTGNTPLHYSIRLCHKNAIQKLLKRPDVSLTVKNRSGKCPLDILNPLDLNTYLDSCIVFDSRKIIDFNSSEYKMEFRFKRLTDGTQTEVEVVSLIGKYRHLEHLLAHPLIHFYIMLKWFKVKSYFWAALTLQAIWFLILSVFFYRFPFSSPQEHVVCFVFCLLHIITKCYVFFTPQLILEFVTLPFKATTLHIVCELLLMVSFIGSFCLKEFRAFVFIEMAVVFLLTAGYHPKLSHWSIMLQTVFRTFTRLLVFFSLLMVAFAAAFHIMFEDHRFFTALYRSVFMSYFMTIGEINVTEVDFETTPFGGYLLFFLFAMSMSVVIINFWTGVAIRDIDKFEKRSEVKALKNVVAFIDVIEKHVFSVKLLRKILPSPLLFPNNVNHVVDFYINKDDQFEPRYMFPKDGETKVEPPPKKNFPYKIDDICLDKIRQHYYKQQINTNEQKILGKLDKILQILERTNILNDKKMLKKQTTIL